MNRNDSPRRIEPAVLYTLREARELLRISDSTARRWIREGRLQARKIGRDYRVLGDDMLQAGAIASALPSGEFGPDHPLLKLIGAFAGETDLSIQHDKYLAEIYAERKG